MRQPKKHEFSKIILAACMVAYLITAVYGYVVIAILVPEQVGELFAYVGAPTAVAIAFYAWKAKAENILKIKGNKPDTLQEIISESGEDNGLDNDNSDDSWSDSVDSADYLFDTESAGESKRMVTVRRKRSGKSSRR